MSLNNPFSTKNLAKEKQKDYTYKSKVEQKIQNMKELNTSKNSEISFLENLDIQKIKELNSKCVEFIFEDKADISIEILKKIELFLETNLIEPKFNIDKKTIIIILHNLACCYQKLKDFDNCIIYLDSVIYHFDKELEKKHQIKINEEYFCQNLIKDEANCNNSLLGDLILELRFSAKFHLQMCAVLSQSNRHIEALKHAKLAGLICEDNLIKTYYLFIQMKLKNFFSLENKANNANNNNNNKENIKEEEENDINNIKLIQKIVNDLFNRIVNLRKHYYNMYININKNNNIEKNNNINDNINIKEKNVYYNSYLKYRKNEIHKYQKNITLLNNIRNLFGAEIKCDDWIHLLNIGNIMYLSPLNDEDLELESDPKYELLRDAILEKIVMLTVSYFCIAMEMKQLSHEQNNKKINGEFFHYQAIFFSNLYLPVSCPIVKHYINSYYKYYEKDLDIVPEGKIFDYKIDLIKNEIEINKDIQSFIRMQKINYSNNNNNIFGIIKKINVQKINGFKNNKELENININNNNTNIKKNKIPLGLKLSLNLDNILNKNNSNNKDININNNSNSKTKKFSSSNDNKYLSNSHNKNFKNYNKYNIENIQKNGNFEIIPSKNNLNIAEKSKIKAMPKFKLNFNNLNTSNEEKLSKDKEKEKNIINIKERIKKIKNKISNNTKTNRHSASINMLKNINFKKNKGYKTERPNSNKRPININDTLILNKKDKYSKLDIKRNSYIKSSYNKHLSKTSRYKNKISPTSNNKGKIKGFLTDRIIFTNFKNESFKKSNEKKINKNNNNNYINTKNNIGYLTQRELIHNKIKEKIGLNNDKKINNKGIKNIKIEKINRKTKSNKKDLKKNKSFNKFSDRKKSSQYNNNQSKNNNIKKNNNSKIESNKKQKINKNKNIGKSVKNNLIDKFYNSLFLIELKDNSNYITNNYRNTIEFNKYGGNPDQIYNFSSLIKLKNPFKS